ncbi:MAG: hypothetical protein U5J98_07160 [Halobacteriales archaeon]|nr:hypothetical protein [Halobacteriales archaeon]
MARYCANESCRRSRHPLPVHGGPCPECGSAQYRLAPDVATVPCPACERPNESTKRTCWACGVSLDHHRVIE